MKSVWVALLLLGVGAVALVAGWLTAGTSHRAPTGSAARAGGVPSPSRLTGTARFVGTWRASDSKMSGNCQMQQHDGQTMVMRQTGPNELVLTPSVEDRDCEMPLRVDGSVASTTKGTCHGKRSSVELTITYSNVHMRTEDGHTGEIDVDLALEAKGASGKVQGCASTLHAKVARAADQPSSHTSDG